MNIFMIFRRASRSRDKLSLFWCHIWSSPFLLFMCNSHFNFGYWFSSTHSLKNIPASRKLTLTPLHLKGNVRSSSLVKKNLLKKNIVENYSRTRQWRLARLKIMKTILSQSKLIRSIRFFTNRRVFLNLTEILKHKLIFNICVLTREKNPWRVVF